MVANPPNSPGRCLNRLGLQARQLQVFNVLAVIGVKLRIIGHLGVHCNLLVEMIKSMANALALPRFGVYKKQVKLQGVENFFGVAKENGRSDDEIGAVQSIVMGVSAARIRAQFRQVKESMGFTGK
jgi:hypothetical protein